MVFRFCLNQYHEHSVKQGYVLQHPSYQYILDTLYPSGCANKFPPEFRRFIIDSYGRTIVTNTLPVPVKGSSTCVDYSTNFESDVNVSLLRRKIQKIILDWKSRGKKYQVYPKYLRKGDVHNETIIERVCYARKVKSIQEGMSRLENVDLSLMDKVLSKSELWSETYEVYTSHVFKTTGEQLKERMGFFMRSVYRELFYEIHSQKMVDDMFSASGGDLDVFTTFENFCNPKSKSVLHFDREVFCRPLLIILVDVSFLFFCFKNKELVSEDCQNIVKECVSTLVK